MLDKTMTHINFRIDTDTKENETDKLILEGNVDALKLFKQRISDVIDNELKPSSSVVLDKDNQMITFDGRKVLFEVSRNEKIIIRKWWKQIDFYIAFAILAACVVLISYALLKTGNKG